ncbi:MAG: hypothetical protein ABJO67_18575 [Pseudoruegeria sp.]
MAYTNTNTPFLAHPVATLSDAVRSFFQRAESFAKEAEKEKELNLLNSVSDDTLCSIGLKREDVRGHVLNS